MSCELNRSYSPFFLKGKTILLVTGNMSRGILLRGNLTRGNLVRKEIWLAVKWFAEIWLAKYSMTVGWGGWRSAIKLHMGKCQEKGELNYFILKNCKLSSFPPKIQERFKSDIFLQFHSYYWQIISWLQLLLHKIQLNNTK